MHQTKIDENPTSGHTAASSGSTNPALSISSSALEKKVPEKIFMPTPKGVPKYKAVETFGMKSETNAKVFDSHD